MRVLIPTSARELLARTEQVGKDGTVPPLEHASRLNDKQRQPNSANSTSVRQLWPELLPRELPQGTARLRLEPALYPSAKHEW